MSSLEKTYKGLSLSQRMDLALSAALPEAYRPLMLEEQWMHVKCYFARRMDLRPAEITVLLEDPDHVIRLCIAKRRDLTAGQVDRCVNDPDANVRYFVARNPLLTDEQRERLLGDEDPLVRQAARKGPRPARTRQRAGQAELVR